ncbi:cytochrome C [Desulfolithobacter sp.]
MGNCLLCHKYPGLSRVDESGRLKLMFVNEDIFNKSVHSKVKCEGCHTDITKIPHDPAKPVDCLTECHIIEPTSEQKFSHKEVEKFLNQSVHSKIDEKGMPKQYSEDMPSCKDCHDNPLFRPLAFVKKVRPGIAEDAMGRCRVCHKKEDFIFRFYNHITTRMHKSRSPLNIAQACGKCHDDPELVARHNLKTMAGYSYSETFHGKAANLLDESVPDCLDCHVVKGKSVHQMYGNDDPRSSTYPANRGKICNSVDCHPGASVKFANYKVHAEYSREQSPVIYWFTTFFIILTGGTLLPLMGIMFLDLLRRLFPNATIMRRRK